MSTHALRGPIRSIPPLNRHVAAFLTPSSGVNTSNIDPRPSHGPSANFDKRPGARTRKNPRLGTGGPLERTMNNSETRWQSALSPDKLPTRLPHPKSPITPSAPRHAGRSSQKCDHLQDGIESEKRFSLQWEQVRIGSPETAPSFRAGTLRDGSARHGNRLWS